ncbi:MAG: DUF2529 family protein [Candidatus Bathyarchaeia archaeon]
MLAKTYLETIDALLGKVAEEQAEKLVKAARMVADAAVSGRRLWVYDKDVVVASEVSGRAGGLLMVQPLGDVSSVQEGDVVVINAARNDSPSDASLVEKAKMRKAKTIAILPFSNPPDASRKLQENVDLAIDDYAEPGDGCLRVAGYNSKVCPTTGVMNAAVMWAVCAEVVDELRRRGREAHVYKSVFRVGSNEWNAKMSEEFKRTGY